MDNFKSQQKSRAEFNFSISVKEYIVLCEAIKNYQNKIDIMLQKDISLDFTEKLKREEKVLKGLKDMFIDEI